MSRESVHFITGKTHFQSRDPVETLLRWTSNPVEAAAEKNIELRNLALKRKLGLPPEQRWFSYRELTGLDSFKELELAITGAHQHVKSEEHDSEERLLERVVLFESLLSGQSWTIIPDPDSLSDTWGNLGDLMSDSGESHDPLLNEFRNLLAAVGRNDAQEFSSLLTAVESRLRQIGPYPDYKALELEVHYNEFRPFRLAWIAYLVGILFLLPGGENMRRGNQIGVAACLIGFAIHGYGFYLRCMIAVMGHVIAITALVKKSVSKELHQSLYRSIQVGVLLLAAGTILGGVWANYSWGRFWGWDPKEVWALIALLGYLALLHGRYAGWVTKFSLATGAIIAFQCVLMAWYGVNFVLGAGLHSYGFGGGGVRYVATYVLLEVLFVIVCTALNKKNTVTSRR